MSSAFLFLYKAWTCRSFGSYICFLVIVTYFRRSVMADSKNAENNEAEMEASRCFKYSILCDYMDRMRHISRSNKFGKQRVFHALVQKWKAETSANNDEIVDFYPVLRIMANSLDGRKYRMKSVSRFFNCWLQGSFSCCCCSFTYSVFLAQ